MKIDDRVLAFILAWILVPRGSNHAQLNIEDILLMHALKERIQVDWFEGHLFEYFVLLRF